MEFRCVFLQTTLGAVSKVMADPVQQQNVCSSFSVAFTVTHRVRLVHSGHGRRSEKEQFWLRLVLLVSTALPWFLTAANGQTQKDQKSRGRKLAHTTPWGLIFREDK